ncbi:MAG: thiosulfate/3-mercaptopyruvate sulfurtransferase [Pseudonocardiales bacterium]|nr:thiosulfate/3-mercaptopyruvate sulfurtransferase [Pseudonocardiales bacterium]
MSAQFGPLVSGTWLAAHLDDVHVVDVRWYLDGRSGRAAYERGHVPGAVWLDIDTDLSAPASTAEGRHPLPTPEHFAAALGRVGIASGQRVVAYDDAGGSIAARLWWLLHVLDDPVAVLDGGLAAWPGPLVADAVAVDAVDREPRDWPVERFVSAAQVAAVTDTAVFDARTAERYVHGKEGIDPRPGHIPGAVSAPWGGNLAADGRFRDSEALRERFAAADGRPAIAYCGSGVTACHDLLAMELAGLTSTALYAGSWSQWGADPQRPTETG